MPETILFVLCFLAGGLAGGFFFGGLWWTVVRVASARRPKLLLVKSFVFRTAVVLVTVYVTAADDMLRLGCYMAGFWLARVVVLRRFRQERSAL